MRNKHLVILGLVAAVALVACGKRRGLSAPMALIEIQPGEFLMGSPEDEKGRSRDEGQHPVRITCAFKLGKYEVTQRQWREVMGMTLRQQRDQAQREAGDLTTLGWRLKSLAEDIRDAPLGALEQIKDQGVWWTLKWLGIGKRWSLRGEGNDYPMYYVDWEDASEFCRQLTESEQVVGRLPSGYVYRLPTEAEWEYACRAGSTTRIANGDTEADLARIAWYAGNSGGATHPVGTKLPNAWGLHDLHGNVWEWCSDWYGMYPSDGVTDPQGASTGSTRVCRGGSWDWNCDDVVYRSADRDFWRPSASHDYIGFRVVLAPPLLPEE